MRQSSQFIVLIALIGMSAETILLPNAQAALITPQQTITFTDSSSGLIDTKQLPPNSSSSTPSQYSNASMGSTTFSQFNASQGVLTGATLTLSSTRTQHITGTGSGGVGSTPTTATGNATSTAFLSAPGISQTFTSATTGIRSCSSLPGTTCSFNFNPSDVTTSAAPHVTDTGILDSNYVGMGMVTATRSIPNATVTAGGTKPTVTTTYTVGWNGSLSMVYEYLLHALPSFDEGIQMAMLDLDFGTVPLNAILAPIDFSVFNIGMPNRAGLDLDSISSGTGDTGKLTTDLFTFVNIEQGQRINFQAFFDTSEIGMFSAAYTLNLSDEDIGAASTRSAFTLSINLKGAVEPSQPVHTPEPSTWLMLATGLGGIFGYCWRCRK